MLAKAFYKRLKFKKTLITSSILSTSFLVANKISEDFSTFSLGYIRSMRVLIANLKCLIRYKAVSFSFYDSLE